MQGSVALDYCVSPDGCRLQRIVARQRSDARETNRIERAAVPADRPRTT